jgi:hypothetical protein
MERLAQVCSVLKVEKGETVITVRAKDSASPPPRLSL